MRTSRLILGFMMLVWLFLSLYPNPMVLVRSIQNLQRLDIDPAIVSSIANDLPDYPATIESAVLDDIVPYSYDWENYGVPWYFPTTEEALADGRGDCESRALVLASILEDKGIPWRLRISIDHMWVDYPGKVPNEAENDARAIGSSSEGGPFALNWPGDLDIWKEMRLQLELYWNPMPADRKMMLFTGILFFALWNAMAAGAARRIRGPLALPAPGRRDPCLGPVDWSSVREVVASCRRV